MHVNDDTSPPELRLIESWPDAEEVACEWMQFMGYADAVLTENGPDGGIDIIASGAIAQVKAIMDAKVGRPAVQALYGAARLADKDCIFFSLSGFSDGAVDFAKEAGVAFFQLKLTGEPIAINDLARDLLDSAIEEARRFGGEGESFYGRVIALLPHPDEHIISGVLRHEPSIEFLRLRDIGLARRPDVDVLAHAATQGLLVVSHDVNTMIDQALSRLAAGKALSGLFMVRQRGPIAPMIESLVLIWSASQAEEGQGQVVYLPL